MKRRLPLLLALVLLALLAYGFLAPHPMLKHPETCQVQYILYYPDDEAQSVPLTDFDNEAIVSCLRKYKAENSWTPASGGSSAYRLYLMVKDGDALKTIGLGEENTICSSQEKDRAPFLYRIKQGAALRDEVFQVLDLPPAD